ncbi:uncharacterized protein LOC130500036 [Raphanus sativus]|uniref:Uncharacterized protein LOC130500036 n=1 Tax=Raphanus sativus TaxID=3726 RepID=A0A9W3CGL7_RAPSA|nr:uncharacterized protein LOC130500036 [Raphanus sativus]
MNIPEQFVHWIKICLSTAAFSVSVNGELEGFFPSTRGLRQGCAPSPYLFVIAINVLSRLLNRAASSGTIGYHPTCSEVNLTHLSFADDIMIFTIGDTESLKGRISQAFRAEDTNMGIPVDTLPVRYLGLPLTTKSMTRADYEPSLIRSERDYSPGQAVPSPMLADFNSSTL